MKIGRNTTILEMERIDLQSLDAPIRQQFEQQRQAAKTAPLSQHTHYPTLDIAQQNLPFTLQQLPEDYECLRVVAISPTDVTIYYQIDRRMVVLQQILHTGGPVTLQVMGKAQLVTVNGEAAAWEQEGHRVIWEQGDRTFRLSAGKTNSVPDFTREELLQVAEAVQ